ncbi:MAG: anhydro-N-acetylmuramic acid kinase [Pseudomonadota bacterium]
MTIYSALGTMSGTSMDGVDVAYLETDGRGHIEIPDGLHTTLEYNQAERGTLFDAVDAALDVNAKSVVAHRVVQQAEGIVNHAHQRAISSLVDRVGKKIHCVGFHGQSILHRPNASDPANAFSLQIGSGVELANQLNLPVVYDFRSADVEAGGEGAPLAPLYHQALLAGKVAVPAAILNLGGIANITLVRDTDPGSIRASDIGPANVFMDDFMRDRLGLPFDEDGRLAAAGTADKALVESFFKHDYFTLKGPKSLDRYSLAPPDVAGLSKQDAMATLTEITVESVVRGVRDLNVPLQALFVAGGGARNGFLMARLGQSLDCKVTSLDSFGASADMLEAQAFAYLAVRHLEKLPISYPNITGVPKPTLGGRLAVP